MMLWMSLRVRGFALVARAFLPVYHKFCIGRIASELNRFAVARECSGGIRTATVRRNSGGTARAAVLRPGSKGRRHARCARMRRCLILRQGEKAPLKPPPLPIRHRIPSPTPLRRHIPAPAEVLFARGERTGRRSLEPPLAKPPSTPRTCWREAPEKHWIRLFPTTHLV